MAWCLGSAHRGDGRLRRHTGAGPDALLRPPTEHTPDRTARPPGRHLARGRVPLRAARCDAQRRPAASCARRAGQLVDRAHQIRTTRPMDGAAACGSARRSRLVGRIAPLLAGFPRAARSHARPLPRVRCELCRQRICAERSDFTRGRGLRGTAVESDAERLGRAARHSLHPRRPRALRPIEFL